MVLKNSDKSITVSARLSRTKKKVYALFPPLFFVGVCLRNWLRGTVDFWEEDFDFAGDFR
jgi:hypothetical protein